MSKTRVFRFLPGAFLLAVVIGGPLLLHVAGSVAPATVVHKAEPVRVLSDGAWVREFLLEIRYRPAGATRSVTARVAADQATYDRTALGARVNVRYLPAFARLPRIADRGPFDWLRNPGLSRGRRDTLVLAGTGVLAFLALVVTRANLRAAKWGERPAPPRWQRPAARLLVLAWLGCFAYAASRPWFPEPDPPFTAFATGKVSDVHPVRNHWLSTTLQPLPLAQPYGVVEVRFVPPALGDTVVGVDAIDAGDSVRVAPDSLVRLRYVTGDPRRIRIDGATRTFEKANAIALWKGVAPLVALFAGIWLVGRIVRRLLHR